MSLHAVGQMLYSCTEIRWSRGCGGDGNSHAWSVFGACSHTESEPDVDLPSSDDALSAQIRCPRAKSSRSHCDCERSGCGILVPSIGTVSFFLSKIVPWGVYNIYVRDIVAHTVVGCSGGSYCVADTLTDT